MLAEVISIGDELTSGQRLDTNSQWLSERLGDLGVRVMYHTTVADDLEANLRVFRQAFDRADVVVVSGGLGPTADDLTRQALAESVGTDLVLDEGALEHIRRLFAHRKREMPPSNQIQAMFPRGSRIIPNPHGSAPGIDMDIVRAGRSPCRVFALPGVPAEMREMWQGTVVGAVEAMAGPNRKVIRHRRFKCFGVGESDLEQMLPDLIRRGRVPQVGITVSKATITLRITAEGTTSDECYASMEPTIATIRQCLGELVYGEEDDELQNVVVRQLAERQQTLATVECGTRGYLTYCLSEAAAKSDVYRGGTAVQNLQNLSAIGLQGLSSPPSNNDDPKSVVEQMASQVRQQFNTDYGLAVGPFPKSMSNGKESGDVVMALADGKKFDCKSFTMAGHPDILLSRTAKQALNMLRLTLLNG